MDRNTLIETLMGMRIQLRASGDLRYADFPTPDFAAQIADALLLLWNEEKELATKESAAALSFQRAPYFCIVKRGVL